MRNLVTRVGTLTLRAPRLRNGKLTIETFTRYQRSEQAFLLALMEMVINGVSTRKIEEITHELCGTEFSKSTISELCKDLDPIVSAWNSRSLREEEIPFVIVDAMVIRVRKDRRELLIAVGVNEKGYREILGLMVCDSELEKAGVNFFRGLNKEDCTVQI